MEAKINQIQINQELYKKLKLENIVQQKPIYSNGQLCDVKIVRLQELHKENILLADDIKSKKYALKTVSKEKIRSNCNNYEREYNYVYNEIYALYIINHPNIIKLYWHYENQNHIYLLLEYGGDNLYKYVKKQKPDQNQLRIIFKSICQGLQALHQRNIMHRDLCLENIAINPQKNIPKIIDLGFAIEYVGGRTSAVGTLTNMAPQVDQQKRYNHKADIWSLGIILYELFHHRNPFVDESKQFTNQQLAQKRDSLQYQINESIMASDAANLLRRMLLINPQHRPSVDQILTDKWITGLQEKINDKEKHSNYLADSDKKTKQLTNNLKERKSLFAFSKSDVGKSKHKNDGSFKKTEEEFENDDDFVFDKMISKVTINNTIHELEERLRMLLKVRAQQMIKKKQLVLEYLALNRKKIRHEFQNLNNGKSQG